MSYYAVERAAGPAWTDGGIDAQASAADHAAFMNALADEGVLLFAGPLAGTERGRLRVLLIIHAGSEEEIRHRLADDPWTVSGHLEITSIESWTVFVGGERLSAGNTAPV
jgi:uncharacterized protein YciI